LIVLGVAAKINKNMQFKAFYFCLDSDHSSNIAEPKFGINDFINNFYSEDLISIFLILPIIIIIKMSKSPIKDFTRLI